MKRLTQLDSLRGLAALFVVFSHMTSILPYFGDFKKTNMENDILNILLQSPLRLFLTGHESVIFFFVLSGFVLALPCFNSIKKDSYKTFMVKRFFRIALPYYVALVCTLLCITMFSGSHIGGYSDWFHSLWSTPITLELIVKHLLLIGVYDTDSYNFVVWSLVHEIRISIIFPLIILVVSRYSRKKVVLLNVIVSIASYSIWKYYGLQEKTSLFATLYYIPMFMIGALLAKNYRELIPKFNDFSQKKRITIFLVGIVLYTYPGILKDVKVIHKYVLDEWLVVIGAVLFILIGLGNNSFSKMLLKGPLNFLGKISYSLYLYHSIVLFSIIYLLGNKLSVIWILLITFILSFIVSAIAYFIVERPSAQLGKYIVNKFIGNHNYFRERKSG
ncbi:acyltransferase [Bacillus albus]|uniref:acyltransferase family protein n=1 Tax=Bacillus albus TaxID=2026189 RepID=UPI002349D00A|nr:acyltransferase [Bacillus albus]MDC6158984.1 acyltransferase [Bacillus albus]MDD8008461.1 acyltransferase [Bacillus albus]